MHRRVAGGRVGVPVPHLPDGRAELGVRLLFSVWKHEGHDTVVYRSETGGACDCGDTEAWAPAGAARRTGREEAY